MLILEGRGARDLRAARIGGGLDRPAHACERTAGGRAPAACTTTAITPPADLERQLRAAGLEPLATYGSLLSGELEPGVDESRHVKAVVIARG